MTSREDNIYYARLAEQGERYEDMIKYMKEVSKVSLIHPKYLNIDLDNILTQYCIEWTRIIK
jgi:hypothetical protein